MRVIAVVTTARSDYSIYRPILRRIQTEETLRLHLIASGMHLSPEFGHTIDEIEGDGIPVSDRVEMLVSSDTPEGIAKSMGLGLIGFSQLFARFHPDIMLVLGDRFEMMSAALASLPFKIPLAHIHGGERTEGAIDEAIRHSITKLSHIHFVATIEYRDRVIQMGEAPWRVIVSGAPGIDNLLGVKPLNMDEIKNGFGVDLSKPTLLVTYHPVTLEYEQAVTQVGSLLSAIERSGLRAVFTAPNADTAGRSVGDAIKRFVSRNDRAQLVPNLGATGYASVMASCAAMVGNSSSGIIEAASFRVPVVNVGTRHRGRTHAENVIDVGYDTTEILEAIRIATSSRFRNSLEGLRNPYGDGHAAERIVQVLSTIDMGNELIQKRFHDAGKPG